MKHIFLGLFAISLSMSCYSQTIEDLIAVSTGQDLLSITTNPYRAALYFSLFDSEEDGTTSWKDTVTLDSLLGAHNYVELAHDSTDFVAIKRKPESDARIFKLLFQYEDILILCEENTSICTCGVSTFIYSKTQNVLTIVERPFGLSLKRNLIYRLGQFGKKVPFDVPKKNYKFSDLLKELRSQ